MPIPRPGAIFEGSVVEARESEIQVRSDDTTPGTKVIVEITRSYHGPFAPGTRVAGYSYHQPSMCGSGPIAVGMRVMVWSADVHAPFRVGPLYEDVEPQNAFAMFAWVADAPRFPPSVAHATVAIRGALEPREAQDLYRRARTPAGETCEIRRAKEYATVSCGSAFHGNDARFKVLFERVGDRWIEVMRYELDTEAEAKIDADATRAAAAAGSTS